RRMAALRQPLRSDDTARRLRRAPCQAMTPPGVKRPGAPTPKETLSMSKPSLIAALIAAALVGAVAALLIVPQVAPPGLLPGIGSAPEAAPATAGADGTSDDRAAVEVEKGE